MAFVVVLFLFGSVLCSTGSVDYGEAEVGKQCQTLKYHCSSTRLGGSSDAQ